MDIQEVDVIIEKDGEVHLKVRGLTGTSCLDVTRSLEAALGGQVEKREMTSEAGAIGQQVGEQQKLRGG